MLKRKRTKEHVLILHNIRSVYNVGAIFRTADAVGITKIYLTGYTPTPLDRFGRERKDVAKAALGAQKTIPWEYKKQAGLLLNKLNKEDFQIIALEQSEKSVDYKKIKTQAKTVFLLGNEVRGISKQLLEKCDVVAEIPMKGEKESLNVSVATGVLLFRVLDK